MFKLFNTVLIISSTCAGIEKEVLIAVCYVLYLLLLSIKMIDKGLIEAITPNF